MNWRVLHAALIAVGTRFLLRDPNSLVNAAVRPVLTDSSKLPILVYKLPRIGR
jgi:hypothetical protein